jgi:uncharacterized protein (DUF1330 family)
VVSLSALSLLGGILIGSFGIQTLQAQNSTPVYSVGVIDIHDADGFRRDYLPLGQAAIKKYGGRPVAAGTPAPLAGDVPTGRVAIYAWDSMHALNTWFSSPEYAKAREVGAKYTTSSNYALPAAP